MTSEQLVKAIKTAKKNFISHVKAHGELDPLHASSPPDISDNASFEHEVGQQITLFALLLQQAIEDEK